MTNATNREQLETKGNDAEDEVEAFFNQVASLEAQGYSLEQIEQWDTRDIIEYIHPLT